MKTFLSAAVFALALSAAAGARAGDLVVDSAWARATPKGAEVGAGYLTIRNGGASADRLTGVRVDFAAAQIHQMKMKNGVMEMREVSGGLEIPPHAVVKLAPGADHLMFVGLKRPLVKGETVKATFSFERAGEIAVDMPVMAIGAAGPAAKK